MQLVASVDPLGDSEFVVQRVQAPLAMFVLNFPASHCEHDPPSGPVQPALQRQAVTTVCPGLNVIEFTGQYRQTESDEAARVAEYLPELQFKHVEACEAPVTVEYLPAAQAVHELSAVPPVVARYLPAAQSVHATVPVTSLNFPAAHAAHAPPSGPV